MDYSCLFAFRGSGTLIRKLLTYIFTVFLYLANLFLKWREKRCHLKIYAQIFDFDIVYWKFEYKKPHPFLQISKEKSRGFPLHKLRKLFNSNSFVFKKYFEKIHRFKEIIEENMRNNKNIDIGRKKNLDKDCSRVNLSP